MHDYPRAEVVFKYYFKKKEEYRLAREYVRIENEIWPRYYEIANI